MHRGTDDLIEVKGLNTYYGASHILQGVDFSVARGETIGLMGRNGMGKSTLLKSIMGLVKPHSGSVNIMGQDMTGASPYKLAQMGIAYVPEGRGIFGNLSVTENLVMAARAGASEAAKARATASAASGRTGGNGIDASRSFAGAGTQGILLRQSGKHWKVVAQPCAEADCVASDELARIRGDFPQAPAAIFPTVDALAGRIRQASWRFEPEANGADRS